MCKRQNLSRTATFLQDGFQVMMNQLHANSFIAQHLLSSYALSDTGQTGPGEIGTGRCRCSGSLVQLVELAAPGALGPIME